MKCEEIREIYLDDHGLVEHDEEDKTFSGLSVGDTLYQLCHEQLVPEIKMRKVNSLSKINKDDAFRVHYESTGFNIADDKLNANNSQGYFLYKKDCEKELQKVCMTRILNLSKAIGAIE
jgi:hypothetical protein